MREPQPVLLTEERHAPTCPWCFHEYSTDDTWFNKDVETGDGDVSEVNCVLCGRSFDIHCTHLVMFVSKKPGEDL